MTYLEKHYDEIFKKYSLDELSKDIENYKYGEGKLNKVLAHFYGIPKSKIIYQKRRNNFFDWAVRKM